MVQLTAQAQVEAQVQLTVTAYSTGACNFVHVRISLLAISGLETLKI